MKDSSRMVIDKDMEYIIGLMEKNMKGTGKMIRKMVKGYTIILMVKFKDNNRSQDKELNDLF